MNVENELAEIKELLKQIKELKEEKKIHVYKTLDIAEILNCNRQTVQLYRDSGLLPKRKIGKKYILTEQELQEFLDYTRDLDLSNEYQIRLAGQIKRETSK